MIFSGMDGSDREVETIKEGKLQVDSEEARNVVLGRDRAALEDGQEAKDSLGCHALVMTMI